jgi:hypothetical protein
MWGCGLHSSGLAQVPDVRHCEQSSEHSNIGNIEALSPDYGRDMSRI